jgi:hypothetical protein
LGTASSSRAGWLDFFQKEPTPAPKTTTSTAATTPELTADEVAGGLKEALTRGTEKAIANLGKPDGFLKNLAVKIPLPRSLADFEKDLRLVGQEKYTSEFVAALNHAAETAVADVGPIFAEAIREMTMKPAQQILRGADDAATQYLRKVGEDRIKEKMLPLVKTAAAKAGTAAAYNDFWNKASFGMVIVHPPELDIDSYVTQKAADGLFKTIAAEEKEIRKNPAARTTDLLRKVFGTVTAERP